MVHVMSNQWKSYSNLSLSQCQSMQEYPNGQSKRLLLFIIFMDNLALEIDNSDLDMYVDDRTIGAIVDTVPDLEEGYPLI